AESSEEIAYGRLEASPGRSAARAVEVVTDQRLRLRRGPVGVSLQITDDVAFVIDEEARRKAARAECTHHRAALVEADREILVALLAPERPHLLHAAEIDRDGHDLELVAAQLGLELVERRQLDDAGRAPGGPEIDDHDLSLEFLGEVDRLALL